MNRKNLFALVAIAGTASCAGAQIFSESFENVGAPGDNGPAGLLSQGWLFPSAFGPGVFNNWLEQGPWHAGQPAAWHGAGFLSQDLVIPSFGPHAHTQWVVLPVIAGQSAGQIVSAHVQGVTSDFPFTGSVQIRYSPTGGINTGSTATDVGDFTVVLDNNSNTSFNAWEELQGVVPGNGRLAIRWSGSSNGDFFGTVKTLFIDDVSLDVDANTPRLPQPGETVHWTTAMSPIHLVSQQVIPRGGTLVIDAGVRVFFDFTSGPSSGPEILVAGGALRFEGTAAAPVVLRRGVNTTQVPSVSVGTNALVSLGNAGTLVASHVDSDVSIGAFQSAIVTVRDSVFARATPIDWNSLTDSLYQVPKVQARNGTAVVERCTFRNAIADFSDSIFSITGCDFDNSRLAVTRFPIAQAAVIDGNTFRNSRAFAPIVLDGYDTRLGAGNVFSNNAAPVALRGGGLTPESSIPTTGSTLNRVLFSGSEQAMDIVGPMTLPPMAVPYRLTGTIVEGDQYDSRVRALAGATIEMDPGTSLSFQGVARFEVLGTPEAPVRFVQAVPGQRWFTFQTNSNPPLIIRNAHFDGGTLAVGGVDTRFTLHDSTVSNSSEGVRSGDYCGVAISKSRFINNTIGIRSIWGGTQGAGAAGVFWEYGASNHNTFIGNSAGAVVDPPYANPSWMQNAWWGSATGPTSPSNPGGSGQSASFGVDVTPFLGAPVNADDHPPVVRVQQVSRMRRLRVGTKLFLHWDARDDGAIVSQRLERIPTYGFGEPVPVVHSIPANARSVELTITDDGQFTQVYRVVSVDESGQEGFDDFHLQIGEDQNLVVDFLTDLSRTFRVGEAFDVALSLTSTLEAELHIDDLAGDFQPRGFGGINAGNNVLPAVSTDLARYVIYVQGEPRYSPYFTIRPQVGFGDEAPTVAMLTPGAAETFAGGAVVPITWTASDDHGIRSFDLQASYDGGESWHVFAAELPAAARSFDWRLPASGGIADVRVRVIVRDAHFQTTSDGTLRVFSITPGGWPGACIGDFNNDGAVDSDDTIAFFADWDQSLPSADVNGDGGTDGDDIIAFFAGWDAGC